MFWAFESNIHPWQSLLCCHGDGSVQLTLTTDEGHEMRLKAMENFQYVQIE